MMLEGNGAVKSIPVVREPHFLRPHRDTEAAWEGGEGRAYGNKWHHGNITYNCDLLYLMVA